MRERPFERLATRALCATLVLACVLSGTLSVAAQTRRAPAKRPVNKAAAGKTTATDEKVDLNGLLRKTINGDHSKLVLTWDFSRCQ